MEPPLTRIKAEPPAYSIGSPKIKLEMDSIMDSGLNQVAAEHHEVCEGQLIIKREAVFIKEGNLSEYSYQLELNPLEDTDTATYKCDLCSFESMYAGSLWNHQKLHKEDDIIACDSCNYRTNRKSNFSRHMKKHPPESVDVGDTNFAPSFTEHISTHVDTEGKSLKVCNICGYKTAHKGELNKHVRIHTGEKPFKCHECDYRANQKTLLTNHMRVHREDEQFRCTICAYKTIYKGELKKHMRIHTGEKPYKCEQCDYRAIQKTHLTNHMRIHTNEQFKCNVCEYKTIYKGDLKKHAKTHEKEKAFQCNQCDYKSNNRWLFTSHVKKVHTFGLELKVEPA